MKKYLIKFVSFFGLALVIFVGVAHAAGLVNVKRTLEHYWFAGDNQIRFGATPNATISYTGGNLVLDVTSGGGKVSIPDGILLGSGALDLTSSLVFEGSTADAFETTLEVVDPNGDNTITLPNSSGAVILSAAGIANTANAIWGAGAGTLSFEGATADAFETSIQVADTTTGDKTFTLPDQTGTAIVSVGGNVDAANAISGGTGTFIFEGTTADAFETTFGVVDPTADAAWSVPNFAVNAAFMGSTLTTNTIDAANSVWGVSGGFTFEGSTADGFETTVTVSDPNTDNTITLPNATGVVVVNTQCTSVVAGEYNPTEASATDDYLNLVDQTFSTVVADEDSFMVPTNTAARLLRAEVDVAPGVGNDPWVVTLMDDTNTTSLTCTIDESQTFCSNQNSVNLDGSSKLAIKVSSAGPDADPNAASALTVSFCLGQ